MDHLPFSKAASSSRSELVVRGNEGLPGREGQTMCVSRTQEGRRQRSQPMRPSNSPGILDLWNTLNGPCLSYHWPALFLLLLLLLFLSLFARSFMWNSNKREMERERHRTVIMARTSVSLPSLLSGLTRIS